MSAKVVDVPFIHTQAVASTSWTIVHLKGRKVNYTAYDGSGGELVGEYVHISSDSFRLDFNASLSGEVIVR